MEPTPEQIAEQRNQSQTESPPIITPLSEVVSEPSEESTTTKVDKRKRKLSPEHKEKMRLGRLKAKAKKELKAVEKAEKKNRGKDPDWERKLPPPSIKLEDLKKELNLKEEKKKTLLLAGPIEKMMDQIREVEPTEEQLKISLEMTENLQTPQTPRKVESTSPSPLRLKLPKSTLEESLPEYPDPQPKMRILSEPIPEPEPEGPVDEELEAFKEFLNTEFGPAGVDMQLRRVFSGGFAPIPPPTRWVISPGLDISHLVWEQVQTDSFINEIWPSVKLLLGDDTLNRPWAAGVATILSLMNVIRILPIVTEGLKDAEREDHG